MAKNIFKEIIIIILLTLASILLLGIILYNYTPTNKIVPKKVEYTSSEEVKKISQEVTQKKEEIPITSYTVTASDLRNYKNVKDYNPGRKNPFAPIDDLNKDNKKEQNGSNNETGENSENTEKNENNGNNGNTQNENIKEDSTNMWPDRPTK